MAFSAQLSLQTLPEIFSSQGTNVKPKAKLNLRRASELPLEAGNITAPETSQHYLALRGITARRHA
ncbi:hypothetical protein LG200_12990 [Methylobacillus caricis]|uniref:hypothetical protein n=1 Tax=Methylobacillus caricis TaxID=1971611 RepID=UPI001CFF83D4|nr:hypothetical protein [Methylobacillus caricis]MCB5188918.1 hypothetical protein [Methylobacillus caricis]